MDKFLKGVLRYNAMGKSKFSADIKRLGEFFKPVTVLFSCMDSRVIPSRFVDYEPGKVFSVKNAGNMVPHYQHFKEGHMVGTEGAALELGVVVNDIQNLVVCGHSDCKAVNTLYNLQGDTNYLNYKDESMLKTWITLHGRESVNTMHKAMSNLSDINQPLVCSFNIGNQDVVAHIDPTDDFNIQDKFSQLHCLQQASHLSTYPFLEKRMKAGKLKVFAMWFDIHKGDVYLFSPRLQCFAIISDNTVDQMLQDVSS